MICVLPPPLSIYAILPFISHSAVVALTFVMGPEAVFHSKVIGSPPSENSFLPWWYYTIYHIQSDIEIRAVLPHLCYRQLDDCHARFIVLLYQ